MGCCKCEEHGWEDDLPPEVVWKDPADNKGYCVFHAPKDEKWIALGVRQQHAQHEFNDLVFQRIRDAIVEITEQEPDKVCHLSGTIFPHPISFRRVLREEISCPTIDLSYAVFCGLAGFSRSTFGGGVFFSSAQFLGVARFSDAIFNGNAWFSQSRFGTDASFYKAKFKENASFEDVEFNGHAWFQMAEFHSIAQLDRTTFEGDARFTGATFVGAATLYDCRAKDRAIRLHALTKESLENLCFTPSDLQDLSFASCSWPDRLGFETHGDGREDMLLACEELYRAMKQKAMSACDMPMASQWHAKEKEMALRQIQATVEAWSFERIKRWAFEQFASAKTWVAAFSEEQVRTTWRVFQKKLRPDSLLRTVFGSRLLRVTWWYKLSSGFGEDPAQAARVLVALVLLVLGPMAFSTMQPTSTNGGTDPELGERIYAALQHLLFITTPQYAPESASLRSLLLVLTRLVIPVQAALFGFAMFNRFRR